MHELSDIDTLGQKLLKQIDSCSNVTGSSEYKSNQIQKIDKEIRKTLKNLAKTRDRKASIYLLEAYDKPYPDSLFYPNGAGGLASPCWMNVHLRTLLQCEINKTLGHTGGEEAFNHLVKTTQRGFGIGQGMSYGSWYPSSAIDALAILGDARAIPYLEDRIGSPFIGSHAQRSIRIIKNRNKQVEQLQYSNRIKIYDTWVNLEKEERFYDTYRVNAFIDRVFSERYETKKQRESRYDRFDTFMKCDVKNISFPEDRDLKGIELGSIEKKVVRKFLEAKKKASILCRLFGNRTRLGQISDDLQEYL